MEQASRRAPGRSARRRACAHRRGRERRRLAKAARCVGRELRRDPGAGQARGVQDRHAAGRRHAPGLRTQRQPVVAADRCSDGGARCPRGSCLLRVFQRAQPHQRADQRRAGSSIPRSAIGCGGTIPSSTKRGESSRPAAAALRPTTGSTTAPATCSTRIPTAIASGSGVRRWRRPSAFGTSLQGRPVSTRRRRSSSCRSSIRRRSTPGSERWTRRSCARRAPASSTWTIRSAWPRTTSSGRSRSRRRGLPASTCSARRPPSTPTWAT